ncbi:MAG: type II toxin-antitoxin system VapC family toxin [Pseudomonadota bacterium]|nr:type II toxin-antitoxin system VapC family toxin [Pseudomonadota bacterium]
MILVDANLVLYAEDALSPQHEAARTWWDAQLSGASPVRLSWGVLCGFIRISTSSRVFERPLDLDQARSRVQSWLDQPCVRLIHPTERHWTVLQELLKEGQALGNLVTDAHLAALAIQHGCTLMSTDGDFARFPKLKWSNPLK